MIVAFSSSSPVASVALIGRDGTLLASGSRQAPVGASGACIKILAELIAKTGLSLQDAEAFVADLGPGSFTGVKVGVTLAKAFAFAQSCPVGGASSFDLIAADRTVVFPSKRGEFFVRRPGAEPVRTEELPQGDFAGFGPGIEPAVFPLAERFAPLIASLKLTTPEALVPLYLIEPSISQPKKPYTEARG